MKKEGGALGALMIVVHSFRSLQHTFEARASEWMLTGAIISLGLVFLLNDTMFLKPEFVGMRQIIPDRVAWSVLFLVIGLVRLTVLLINGAYWRTPHFRAITAFLCAGVWFMFLVGFVRNGSILLGLMPWVFLLDSYNVKRASREAGSSEYIQRYVKKKQETKNAGMARSCHP